MSAQLEADIDFILEQVRAEILRAKTKHPKPMNSAHEGYAVLLEEVAELWDLVKLDEGYSRHAMEEALQIAAMAVRYVLELHEKEAVAQHDLYDATDVMPRAEVAR